MRNSITDFDIQIQSDELAARDDGDWINDFDNEEDDEFFDD